MCNNCSKCNNHKERVVEITWIGINYEVEILDENNWLLINIATGKEQVCAKTDLHAHFQDKVLEKLSDTCSCKTNNEVVCKQCRRPADLGKKCWWCETVN